MIDSASPASPGDSAPDVWHVVTLVASSFNLQSVIADLEQRLGAPVTHAQLRASVEHARQVVESASNVIEASERRRAWESAVAAAAQYTRLAGEPLSEDLIRFAQSVVHARPYRYRGPTGDEAASPPGAPPPRDWVVWAHRVLDRPLVWRTSPDRRGRTHRIYRDPWSVALSDESTDALPAPRRWDAQARRWIGGD